VHDAGGIVRLGIACKKYVSNTSSEQFLFVLKMYSYLGIVSDMLLQELKPVTQRKTSRTSSFKELKRAESIQDIAEIVPSDMAVYLSLKALELKLLESVPGEMATDLKQGHRFHRHPPNTGSCSHDIFEPSLARHTRRLCGNRVVLSWTTRFTLRQSFNPHIRNKGLIRRLCSRIPINQST
jgi:hypothetical protein